MFHLNVTFKHEGCRRFFLYINGRKEKRNKVICVLPHHLHWKKKLNWINPRTELSQLDQFLDCFKPVTRLIKPRYWIGPIQELNWPKLVFFSVAYRYFKMMSIMHFALFIHFHTIIILYFFIYPLLYIVYSLFPVIFLANTCSKRNEIRKMSLIEVSKARIIQSIIVYLIQMLCFGWLFSITHPMHA